MLYIYESCRKEISLAVHTHDDIVRVAGLAQLCCRHQHVLPGACGLLCRGTVLCFVCAAPGGSGI